VRCNITNTLLWRAVPAQAAPAVPEPPGTRDGPQIEDDPTSVRLQYVAARRQASNSIASCLINTWEVNFRASSQLEFNRPRSRAGHTSANYN
jgi:hypothetical protein